MGLFHRIFGICRTKPPADPGCWSYAEGRVEVDRTRVRELDAPGGAVRLEGLGLPVRLLLVSDEDRAVHAFCNRCSHAGRRLDPLPGQARLECCSVGRSLFDHEGRRQRGLARKDITVYQVEVMGQKLVVRLG